MEPLIKVYFLDLEAVNVIGLELVPLESRENSDFPSISDKSYIPRAIAIIWPALAFSKTLNNYATVDTSIDFIDIKPMNKR